MFKKVLIANRGEIAVRIIRTCNRLGIGTVAVYSDADSRSLHRQLADEAVHIGPSPSQQSYLVIDKIIEAARATGAEAVHPGYGFLSENAEFARAVEAAGMVFIGPPVEAVNIMGDKITSKELAKNAGVPVIPGHIEAIRDEAEALKIAEEVGYPILLKPAAGGGGKGMRIVRKAYGGAYLVMNSKHIHCDVNYAWPTAEIAVMGPKGAAEVIHRKEIYAADDPEAVLNEKMEEYRSTFANPFLAAQRGYIDDVIFPRNTRRHLIRTLQMLDSKRTKGPDRKHGNIPL